MIGELHPAVLFRVDAGVATGFGHVRRCYALAVALRRLDVACAFLLREAGPGRDWLAARGEQPRLLESSGDEALAVATEVRRHAQGAHTAERRSAHGASGAHGSDGAPGDRGPIDRRDGRRRDRAAARRAAAAVVVDVAEPVERRYVLALQQAGCRVVLIDNAGSGRLRADLAVSPAAQPGQSWLGAAGQHVASPAYAILAEPFVASRHRPVEVPRVLVTMGGSDPDGLTFTALAALDLIEEALEPVLVVGPAFPHLVRLRAALAGARRPCEVHYNVAAMAPLVATADVALAAFGTSAYELAAAGLPAVLVPRRDTDRWHAEIFAGAGAAVTAERRPEGIAAALRPVLADAALRRRLGAAGERLVDGRGAERVAALVAALVRGGRAFGERGAAGADPLHASIAP